MITHMGIKQSLSLLYYQHGLIVSHYPKTLLFLLCVAIATFTSPILMWSLFDKLTISPRYWSSNVEYIGLSPAATTDEPSISGSYFQCILHPDQCIEMPPSWFYGPPAMSVQQIVVSLPPYRQPIGNILRSVQKISEQLLEVINASFEEFQESNLQDICLRVDSSFLDHATYSNPKCLTLSPLPLILNVFHEKPSKSLESFAPQSLSNDSQLRNPYSSVKELLFGGFWTHWSSLLGLGKVDTSGQLTFSLTLFLNTSSQQIQTLQTEFINILHRNLGSNAKQTEWLQIFYPQDEELVELFPLIFLYSIVFLYISISVSKIEEVKSRVGLAFVAVLTLFGSVCISVGVCILFGLRATLDGRDVVPFIIVVIGLENILLITKSVISTPRELDTPLRIAKGLGLQGVAITRSMVTQISLLMVAYLTFNPSIQEFCLISILGLVNNFFLTMAFFLPILSIDLKRLELSDMRHTTVTHSRHSIEDTRTADPNFNSLFLKIIHKLEEMRILHTLFSILLCVFLAWWLITSHGFFQTLSKALGIDNPENIKNSIYSIIGSDDSAPDKLVKDIIPPQNNPYFKELHENIISDSQYVYDRDSSLTLQISNDSGIALCGAYPCWTELIKYHVPNLFSYYDMSLTGKYITLLPPIYLRAVGSLEVSPSDNGHHPNDRYLKPPEFGVDVLLMTVGTLLSISFILVMSNQLVFRLTLCKGMPSNSDLHNANITCQLLGTLYDGSNVIQPIEYVVSNNNNIIATKLRDTQVQLWSISAKQNSFSINQHKQIHLSRVTPVDSSDLDQQTEGVSDESTDSSRSEKTATIKGYEFPKHFSFLSPHLEALRATLPERPKRVQLVDPNAPILWCIQCNESWLAAGFHNGLVSLWDIYSNRSTFQIQPTSAGITCIQIILRPHNLIICGTVDGHIIKISIANPSLLQMIKISDNMTTHLEYAHNRVVVSNFECALRVYRVDRMTELYTLLRHPGYITCISIDNACLLACTTGCKNGMVCRWDLETGTCVRSFQETNHKIISVLTSKVLIISLSLDRIVRMRDRVNGELVKKVEPDTMPRSMCLLTENQLVVGCKGCAVLYNLAYDMLEPKVIKLRDGKEMDHVSKILRITPSVFVCTTRKYIYMLSWGISRKEKSE
ncbi:Sterol regulatory element-binding protein cleavage-activating protein isoform X2 [Oopsacas minuta]|uniref:Sterol regulatory element-binding protein cleavage-activating protein n=1 Tax=Oopsacas minuta TaxID=111878 RepID=A0AAV7JDK1_9METZ|nr:Sterol regulatory element-binding protein cleavage-activating protein isoform X2 [Oopsacas minuta]